MISILIPIYNFDVTELVSKLHTQGEKLAIDFEIICIDDASENTFNDVNKSIADYPRVNYHRLGSNIGRSSIRNLLAKKSRFPFLLFMDCDAAVPNDNFLSNYCEELNPAYILYGGRCYTPQKPLNSSLYLHWHYGTQREVKEASERNKQPYHSFMTNNFLIPAAIFKQIKFDESLLQYGHEDTLFGLELKKRKIPIKHLNNPLMHIGLENDVVFLKKTEQAIQNLIKLYDYDDIQKAVKLIVYYKKLERLKLTSLLSFLFKLSNSLLRKHFKSSSINLYLFDFYKLGYLATLAKTKTSFSRKQI